MLALFSLVFFAVVVLWLYASFFRNDERSSRASEIARTADDSPSVSRDAKIARRWIIGGGLLLPSITIAALLAFGIPVGHRLLPLGDGDTQRLTIHVVGHQWWWEVRYPTAAVTTANELVIPVNEPVDLHLTSNDVIHAFWVPRLGGKLDMLPGRTTVLRLQATETGTFRGQCAEFCGAGHTHMVITVTALEKDDYESWLRKRQQPLAIASRHAPAATAFEQQCAACHRVGTGDRGDAPMPAPNLGTIGVRESVGGRPRVALERDAVDADADRESPSAIAHWLKSHRPLSSDGRTPDHGSFDPQQLELIARWLETLGHE